jgi:hypothetical protein
MAKGIKRVGGTVKPISSIENHLEIPRIVKKAQMG